MEYYSAITKNEIMPFIKTQRMRWLDSIKVTRDMSLSKLWEMMKDRETWRAAVHGFTKSRT